jgi:hypothetical protein
MKRPYMLERLARDTGMVKVSGRHTHLVQPGQKVKSKSAIPNSYNPFNGGGAAA